MEMDGFLADSWGVWVWREEVVEGVECWESLDILLCALILVDEDVEEILL